MKILVTGGAGYVGSHAVRSLEDRGHYVKIFDNLSAGHRELVQHYEVVHGDLKDSDLLRRELEGIDVVMHFAASAYVGESVVNPRKYFRNNVENGLSLLNAVVDAGVRQFVFSSTCAVYGIPESLPVREDSPCKPVNPYGDSKLFFERALAAYDHAYGLKSVRLRYFNAAGADAEGRTGELHDPETHLLPLALECAAGLRTHLDVYGHDYETPDGTCIRDFTHVSDLASAHAKAVDYLTNAGSSCTINLGTGKGHSVNDVISTVERVSKLPVNVRKVDRRAGDPPVLVADVSRAAALLDWRAVHSLEDMVQSAWRWMNSDMYRRLRKLAPPANSSGLAKAASLTRST